MKSIHASAALAALVLALPMAALGARPAPPTSPAAHPTAPARPAPDRTLGPTRATGQPNASCEDTPNTPGKSAAARGSAFSPDGVAGTHYAGEQPQNSRNSASVSQYDVACTRPRH